ncbi:MAG: type II secretion system protein [Candidatus Omnitrophota bacterium]|nr:type II secretion system protein [Candidatus Omnitrophota bacterium]
MLIFWTSKLKRERSFLLIEALLTIVILSTCLTFFVRSFLTSLQAGKVAVYYIEAGQLLESNFSLLESQVEIDDDLHLEENFKPPYESFKFKLNSQNLKEDGEVGFLNQVAASVSWPAQKKDRSISVATYLRNKKNEEGE